MTLKIMLCLLSGLASSLSAAAPSSLELGASHRISERLQRDLGGPDAKKTVRGAKALWTQVVVQKFSEDAAAATLESDLKLADMEAQLRSAGLKIMDPAKRSLALGLRPTLVVTVLFEPKGGMGNELGFYLVLTSASQDVTPLGGEKTTMTTWFKASDPIPESGEVSKDIAAIRAAARAGVLAFIDVAQDNEGESDPDPKPQLPAAKIKNGK